MTKFMTDERRAQIIGKIDAILTAVFAALSLAAVELVSWALTVLPSINTSDWGEWNWLKIPVVIVATAFLKGLDRKKHEDPSGSTGLVNLPKSLTENN